MARDDSNQEKKFNLHIWMPLNQKTNQKNRQIYENRLKEGQINLFLLIFIKKIMKKIEKSYLILLIYISFVYFLHLGTFRHTSSNYKQYLNIYLYEIKYKLHPSIQNLKKDNHNSIHINPSMSNKNQCVKVAVRCRPMSQPEVQAGYQTIVHIKPQRGEVIVTNTKDVGQKQRVFSFDMAFEQTCLQKSIFDHAALPIVQSVLQGYNGTIFAYGQTGTGKTHTMQGSKTEQSQRGVIPRTFQHIIKSIQGTPGVNFMIQVSMLELYNEQVVDLLSGNRKNKLQIHQDKDKGVYVKDLSAFTVKTVDDMKGKLKQGSKSRHVGSTEMNSVSSRSHSIFVIRIEQEQEIEGQSKIKAGRLNLVDLAGSQRQKKTQATGGRSKQGIYINSALSVLGQVIGALTSPNPAHVPYRDSKLTRLLQESLGGNARTIMIANVGPASFNYEQTMSTLRYAYQAKKIKNKPKINDDPKDALIREYQEEIQRLKKQLEGSLPPDGVQVIEKRVKVSAKRENLTAKMQKQKQKQLENEKQKVLGSAQGQKQQLKSKAIKKQQQKQAQRKRQEQLAVKLKQMKQAFIRGNKLKQQARLHQKKILQANIQLQQRIQRERRMQQQLKKRIDEQDEVKVKNLTLKQQVEHRRTQLKKLNNKLKIAYEQNNDIQQFMAQQRQQLQQQNRSLVRELKLVNMIIEHFVPIQEVAAIQHRLEFDQGFDDWVIVQNNQHPKPNPGSALGLKAPLCTQGRMSVACGDDNPRFRQENIVMMDLNLVDSPTENFQSYQISQSILENLSVALNDNQEEQRMIAKEERPNVYIDDPEKMNKEEVMRQRENSTRAKSAKKMRPASGKKKK